MTELLPAAATALWLGVLTSISPCPLATNVAAVSYIGRRLGSPRRVLLTGLLYALGRTLVYLILGTLLVAGALSVPGTSHALQKYMNRVLGPVLILAGMFLLELLRLGGSGGPALSERMQNRFADWGVWGGGLLGVAFALSFCPLSAALFFLSLVPLAIRHESVLLLPALYGAGTGLPVVVFAVLIALGAKRVGEAYNKIVPFERWARRVTGGVFILVGIYYSLGYIFGVL